MRHVKGYIMIFAAALLWGLSATGAKFLLNQNLSTIFIVQSRVSISAILLFIFAVLFRPGILRVKGRELWVFLLLGIVGMAGTNFTYYYAIKEGTVATAVLIQYSAPLIVMVYGIQSKEEPFTVVKLVAAMLTLTGCFLAVGGYDPRVFVLTPLGLVCAIASALFFAFITLFTRRLVSRYSLWTTTLYSCTAASFFWLVVNPPWKIIAASPSAGTWGFLVVLAVVSILLPYVLFFGGLRYVVPSRAIIACSVEPIVAIISAAIIIGEPMRFVQVIGAALVIGAIILLQLRPESGTLHQIPPLSPESADAA
jgi:drug/metabolite transporter (DMT)-like permease